MIKHIYILFFFLLIDTTVVKAQNLHDNSSMSQCQDIEKILTKFKSKQSFQAEFRQEKILSILSKPLVSSGKIKYELNKEITWEILQPVKSLITINQTELRQTQDNKVDFVISRGSDPSIQRATDIFFSLLSGDLKLLSSSFNTFCTYSNDKLELKLIPRDQNLLRVVDEAVINISDQIDLVSIKEPGSDYTNIELKNYSYS